ncbi:MAG TPA: hypothetical protein VKE74_08325 [Gemmataceae bacterium]|nr:hypothetical protein [Gemmataceae bacterium]
MRLMSLRLWGIVAVGAVALVSTPAARLGADDQQKPKAEKQDLAKELIGTWVLVGTPDKIGEVPKSGGRLKFRTGRHWMITEADPQTGEVIFHHGGTYTIEGDEYVETVEYANKNTAGLIGMKLKFKVKVEKDTYTQIGVGNSFDEVWKRVK